MTFESSYTETEDRDDMTMQSVVINKPDLLKVLQENRAAHREFFERAIDGWQILVQKKIEEIVERAKAGDYEHVFYQMVRPEDHTKDYDRAIRMLELDIHDTVRLAEAEFATYVQDDWGWKKQWATSNSAYFAASQM